MGFIFCIFKEIKLKLLILMKNKLLKGFLLFLLVSTQINAYGQQIEKRSLTQSNQIIYKSTPSPDGTIRCHTMEVDSVMRAQNPTMPSLEEDEIWLQQKIQEFKAQQEANGVNSEAKLAILTIPVVVHVIHNGDAVGSGENIADGQVLSQIQVMNEDFRRMLGTNGYNTHPDGADVEIEFCLAVIDPSGAPTDGIDRVNYGTASFTSTGAVDAMKATTFWPRRSSFNPATATSLTEGCKDKIDSISTGEIFSPPEMIMSSTRPVTNKSPDSSK